MTLHVSLISAGDPDRLTGGNLYDRRMREAAPTHDARIRPFVLPADPIKGWLRAPALIRAATGPPVHVAVVDGIAAAALAPFMAGGRPRVPFVALLHQPPGGVPTSSWRRCLDMATLRRARETIVVDRRLADLLVEQGCARGRIHVVTPGCDAAPRRPTTEDLRAGRRVAVLCVANWTRQKGVLDLVEAFAELDPGLATLHLVGDTAAEPAHGARILRRVRRPDLAGRVVVHGPRPPAKVEELRSNADLFALPARGETYGMAWAEALRAGLPVVGYRSGSLPGLIDHGREGLLVPVDDVRALSGALHRLSRDDELRARLRGAALARGGALPTWEQTARRFFTVLRRAAGRPESVAVHRGEGRATRTGSRA